MTTDLGRFQLGQSVPLAVATVDGQGAPASPDAAPTAAITGPSGDPVATVELAMAGDDRHFALPFFLGLSLPLGTYGVAYSYLILGAAMAASATFTVIPGGDTGGAIISMFAFDRPEARYVVAQLESGRLVQGRNPR